MERPEAAAASDESRKGARTWLLGGVLVVVCLVAALPFYCDATSAGRVPHEEDTAAAVAADWPRIMKTGSMRIEP